MPSLVRIALLTFLLSSPLVACASIQFDIGTTGPTGNRWVIGSGWGTDASEMQNDNPTLLGAAFGIDSGLPSVSFPLTNVGNVFTFLFGTINLTEPNGMGGILASETDDLGVTGYLQFDNPASAVVANVAILGAVTGPITDSATDLTIAFTPVSVLFAGGSYLVDLGTVVFMSNGTQNVNATVTLATLNTSPSTVGSAPEPATAFIWLTFIGLVATRRITRR